MDSNSEQDEDRRRFGSKAAIWLLELMTECGRKKVPLLPFDRADYSRKGFHALMGAQSNYSLGTTLKEMSENPPVLLLPLPVMLWEHSGEPTFGAVAVVPNMEARTIELEAHATLTPTEADMSRLRADDSTSPWVRAGQTVRHRGAELRVGTTTGTGVHIGQTLPESDLDAFSRLTDSGELVNDHAFRQVMDFALAVDAANEVLAKTSAGGGQSKTPASGAPRPAARQQSSGGCYVATAVYGSYDCPEVWVLRRWRDDALVPTKPGRAFVRAYYAVSPRLVRIVGKQRWFIALTKKPLDRLVARLRRSGIADAPYRDI